MKASNVETIPDIEVEGLTSEGKTVKYCFTDGIGKISFERAQEICHNYYDIKYASAFQIRYGGFKGVVAIDRNMSPSSSLQFRPSMKKFDSGHSRLDVLNIADYIPCYLNRQVILIFSALGVPDSVFSDLQDEMLQKLGEMLLNKQVAAEFIKQYYRNILSFSQNSADFNYSYEPFFRNLLKTIYRKQLWELKTKSRIFVKEGRILMGCIDETGILNENEVFVQYSDLVNDEAFEFKISKDLVKRDKYLVHEGKVAVAKNPCMHPGDVRILNAVDVPELRHMVNTVVFPAKGPRPITNMCSGSDLDGDLYFVTWDKRLIPPENENAMDYDSPPAKEKDNVTIDDVIDFFVEFIEVDQLGRIANAHVAISDFSPRGVKDPTCVELAKAFSLAVDFPKTGVVPQMPTNTSNLKYPDFMGKSGPIYESQKIIGKMYRKCKSIYINEHFNDPLEVNPSFIVNGNEKYLDKAKEEYAGYRAEIERLMVYFGCKHESELLIGVNNDRR